MHCSIAALALVLPGSAGAETLSTNSVPRLAIEGATNQWSFSASVYGYVVPESRDYANPNLAADRGRLHLEARYNYEALETGSLWVGYSFSVGEQVVLGITPMLGGVFGDLTGVAPGYNFDLTYKRLSLSSQGEYVLDAGDSSGNFFYTWSELSYSPVEWFRLGLVVQRTKAHQSTLDIQRGFLVGASCKQFDFTTYVFNLGWTDPTVVLAMGFDF